MSSITDLIDQQITDNQNQEITGPILNGVLKAMIQDLGQKDTLVASTMDHNSGLIETKVNAILLCLADLITKIVFHSGVPYQLPTELQQMLDLQRIQRDETTAICGVAICGVAICGTN